MSQSLNGMREFCKKFSSIVKASNEVAIFPSFVQIPELVQIQKTSKAAWRVGAQNCSTEKAGAFTGEVSADSLIEVGAQYVLIGHSECRQRGFETPETLKKKLEVALGAGLQPVFCVGETERERLEGRTMFVVRQQLEVFRGLESKVLLAYEPVWAIGTGRIPKSEEVLEVHSAIWTLCPEVRAVLYGGSVKPENASELAGISGVSGFLVGGASLKADSFEQIIQKSES